MTFQFRRPKLTWRRLVLGSLGAGTVAVAIWLCRQANLPEASGAPAPQQAPQAPAPQPPPPSDPTDYSKRAVAFIYDGTMISREQLGEYLIARFGPDKVLNLVNKLIIERKCRDHGIEVADAEVNIALADSVADFKGTRPEFIQKVLREKRKSLYEWKEDVIRPKLLLTKLLRDRVHVNDDDVRKAFESAYGERLYCQAIMWPMGREQQLGEMYEAILKDPVEFTRVARTDNSPALVSVGGMLEPVSHHSLGDQVVEKLLFTLNEGEVTPVTRVTMGRDLYCAVIKVLKKLPPDPTKKLEDVRPALEKEIIDAQVRAVIPDEMAALQKAADPKIVLKPDLAEDDWVRDEGFKRVDVAGADGLPPSQRPVAYIYGTTPVTREQLGEYLIVRYGAERLDLMVNKFIVEKECEKLGITVSEEEVRAALDEDMKMALGTDKPDRDVFIKQFLRTNRTTLYGYREDVLRPKLLLGKLARGHVKVEADDLRKAFEAYHGEKAECQIIMWPRTPRDHEIAIKQYGQIRKSPEEFDRAAKTQASARLAATAGRIDPFARHSTGNEKFEDEVFLLRPGEITPVIETPQGYVVARLLRKVPADKGPQDPAAAAAERAAWEAEILRKKAQMQVPAEFAKLREAAAPHLILEPTLREEDWMREVKQEITGTEPAPVRPRTN